MSDSYRVIAIDRLGHGASDKPHDPAEYLEHLIVSDIVAVLDAEQVDQVIVWGYSMGLRNALSLAVIEPTRVSALVAGGGGPVLDTTGRTERILEWAEMVKTEDGLGSWLGSIGVSDERIDETLAHNDAAALSAAVAGTADWFPVPDDVGAPSLWYIGSNDNDGFSPEDLDVAERLDVKTHLIPDADHAGAFWRAEDVLSIVRPFLDKHRI